MQDWRKIVGIVFKVVLPLATVGASVGAAMWLYKTRPEAAQQEVREAAPAISAVRLERQTVCFPIRSQGSVQPRRETTLTARVAGQVEWVAECFDESGFFAKGDVLARIDRRDYAIRIQRLEASVRSAKANLLDTQQDLKRQQSLTEYEATTKAALQQATAVTEMAAASVEELDAQLTEAQHAESDTQIIAPFDGCIRETNVEVGQFVTIGTKLASCFATDAVEVRLPVTDDEFAFLGLTLGTSLPSGSGPAVELTAEFAGRECRWVGSIVRSEAIIDSRSRMVYLVAQVKDPYSITQGNGGQPLAVGMFVEATIRCPPMADAIVLPESCVSNRGVIFVVNSDGRLELAQVEILRREQDWIVALGDIPDAVTVCSTRLENAVPGMAVKIHGEVTPVLVAAGAPGDVIDLTEQIELATRLERTER
jgi:RND family efflux transporter MFP subunit